jgi:sarcosine oxidase delta subunit
MSRIRLNSEYRNKGAVRFREHLEQENTQEKEAYLQAREQMKPLQDETWKLAEKIVRRHYTDEDVKMAYHLQNKFDNVSTIAKDSCFHFGYMGKPDEKDEDDKYITKHFDFKLNGNINGSESGKQDDFAYAYFRDELKGRDNCNPDINIEQKWGKGEGTENLSNPHWTKCEQANEKYLGLNNDDHSYAKEWNNDYKLDLIGREYCRDRQIGCTKDEFDTLMIWQVAKQKLIQCHTKWIESILNQMKEIKLGLKGYRYLDEMIELGTELGLTINDAEIIRCNSTGLVIYNPKNLADRVKGMKNKSVSREQKILARKLYEQQFASN